MSKTLSKIAPPVAKIEELESIRGIAALLVVLFHMPDWNGQVHDWRFVRNGYYMVDLFFVLSGFVMSLNYSNRLNNVADLIRFQFLRLGRLYPVHVLFLLVALLTAASSWFAATALGLRIPNGTAFKDATLAAFIAQLLLIHSLGFFRIAHPFNLPSWSISVEFYTYLIFAGLCLLSRRLLRLSIFAGFAGAALLLLAFAGESVGGFSEILQCLAGFFLGCLVAPSAGRFARALPRGSTAVALVAMTLFLSLETGPHFDITIFFLSALLIIAVICSTDDYARQLLRRQSLKFLGLISYSIYMSHIFVLWVCNQFLRVAMHRPEVSASGISTPQLSISGALLWQGIALTATICLSALVFKYVEEPCRLKSKEYLRPAKIPVSSLAAERFPGIRGSAQRISP